MFSGVILLLIAGCALYFGPFGPSGQPDPRVIQTAPRPDYFFLWLYAVLSLLPPQLETPALLIGPAIALLVLIALPFVSGEGEKSWKRRPIAVLTILLVAVALGTFTHLADHAPWSPVMDASSGAPIPDEVPKRTHCRSRSQGALVFRIEAMPQLPRSGRHRRPARAGSRCGRGSFDSRSACPAGASGRRQHARLREEPESRGDDCAGGVSRDAASRRPVRGPRCVAPSRSG